MSETNAMDLTIDSPGFKLLLEYVEKFVRDDQELRLTQSKNAPQPVAYGYGNGTTKLSETTPLQPIGADPTGTNQSRIFSFLVFVTDEASGKARYTVAGDTPKADGSLGLPLYSGGSTVVLEGNKAIQNFQVIAETGETVNFAWVAYA